MRNAIPSRIVGVLGHPPRRIGDANQLSPGVIGKLRRLAGPIDHRGFAFNRVERRYDGRPVRRRVLDQIAGTVVRKGSCPPQRICNLRPAAIAVEGVHGHVSERVGSRLDIWRVRVPYRVAALVGLTQHPACRVIRPRRNCPIW